MIYWRPVGLGDWGLPLAGGPLCFAGVERLERGVAPERLPVEALPEDVRERLTAVRPGYGGRPLVMGILNVTPDSFSDGGQYFEGGGGDPAALVTAGADIVDVGAESTRPGAAAVALEEELRRLGSVLPALAGVRWSVDTRKAAVMAAALDAGAGMINDVSALTHDPAAMALVAARGCPVVLMHHQGEPATMQVAPAYDDVLLEVFDWLAARIDACLAAGIGRERIVADVGIGFGKSLHHNRALLRGLALFHALGVPLLLGASRKRVIEGLAGRAVPVGARLPGSLAVALHGAAHGVQILRVHDVAETVQALAVWRGIEAA
ncbi:dihydropteroate synthase [Polymorphobacter multimanifer]|uniref:Dihydropteroate synthase n=1 Tax=Polymorphobacter multimanifer TaxID=1070431 RepID=A0A841L524_9SPHN|nr:dihydropteroate synthase [Polymorphobacter multimanifer]